MLTFWLAGRESFREEKLQASLREQWGKGPKSRRAVALLLGTRTFLCSKAQRSRSNGERTHFRAERGENNQRPFPIDSAKVKPATIGSVEPATYASFDSLLVRVHNEAPKDRQSVFISEKTI